MRARVLSLLVVAVTAFAGCLESGTTPEERGAGTTPTVATPSPSPSPAASPTPSPTPPTPEDTNVTMRTLAVGQHTGVDEPMREVLETEEAWAALWERHGQDQIPPPERPEVDFAQERVVAVVLEQKPNGCWAVRATNATHEGDRVRVEVTTYRPPPDAFCPSVITRPFHFVAIPRGAPVEFVEREAVAGPGSPPPTPAP